MVGYWLYKVFLYSKAQIFWRQILLAIMLALCFEYFLYHSENGNFGSIARKKVEKEISFVQQSIENIEEEIKILQSSVDALGNYPDNDTLDQAARKYLHYANPEEYIIIVD